MCSCGHKHNCSSNLPANSLTDTLVYFFSAQSDTSNMMLLGSGRFLMGGKENDTKANNDEYPNHWVYIDSFWVDKTEVTNRQFRLFVEATGYKTTAERIAPGGSLVFYPSSDDKDLSWWKFVEGANWRQPYGPGSNIDTMDNYPVIHVSWFDAMAYASWAGKRLPTEAEWEYAARSGLVGNLFPWGNENPETEKLANVFQGEFPYGNNSKDGYIYMAPVGSFPVSKVGLYDMSGNVWEWCMDKYHSRYYSYCKENGITAPRGPMQSFSSENLYEELRVIRGGSFLCNSSYCTGYRVSARNKTSPSTSLMNVGFRCVKDY